MSVAQQVGSWAGRTGLRRKIAIVLAAAALLSGIAKHRVKGLKLQVGRDVLRILVGFLHPTIDLAAPGLMLTNFGSQIRLLKHLSDV